MMLMLQCFVFFCSASE